VIRRQLDRDPLTGRPHPKSPSGWTGRAGRVTHEAPAMMAPGVLLYRCRLCGESKVEAVPAYYSGVFLAINRPALVTFHDCGHGQLGVADLLGGKADATEEPPK
jgi:hypothetical protein